MSMSASDEMMREHLDRIISRTELRIDEHRSRASAIVLPGDEAMRAQNDLTLALGGLAKLKTLRDEFSEPQPRPAHRPSVGVPAAGKHKTV
jgi:hypothetical protein